MSQSMLSLSLETLQQAKSAFEDNNYALAAILYEQLAELEPAQLSHVWYLGLARLLAGQEAEAQLTWMMALSEAEPEEAEQWAAELAQILQLEAERQETAEAWPLAWAIRQHWHELNPTELQNSLHLVQLAVKLKLFDDNFLIGLNLTELLQSQSDLEINEVLLLQTVLTIIEQRADEKLVKTITEAALPLVKHPKVIQIVFGNRAHQLRNYNVTGDLDIIIYLAEICLRYEPDDIDMLRLLSDCYERKQRYTEAIELARRRLSVSKTLEEKLNAIGYLCIHLLKLGSCWDEVQALFNQQKELMEKFLLDYQPGSCSELESTLLTTLFTFCSFYTYYLKDAPAEFRSLQNRMAAAVETELQIHAKPVFSRRQKSIIRTNSNRKLKVGYIARYMQQHPVGFIARWLMQYHNYDRFEIYTYHLHVKEINDFIHHWFVEPVTRSAQFDGGSWAAVAQHICEEDQIDILVDLDSITYSETCKVMALKPAPVQLTWMGFDASGLPAIDYYIADPYVLQESAQDYYNEKIWRLPNTYLAVNGYEVGVPTLRRDLLDIPSDAVVYLSAQDGRKRHPEMIRLQIQILREVPNSYLLLKGLGDETTLRQAFNQIAEEEGVSPDRLRFLERDINEPIHRANLGIADVVLDTYPYNGASTTLETLWVGIPVVTRVGQQWAARNSYTMLKNVGVDEGIAWTDEEYVEWGIRLGKDAALRHDIHLRLLQSRQTSPLWNTKQFAREMENAYEQMWQIYLDSH